MKPFELDDMQIVSIAQKKGVFFVSPLWRNDALRERCYKLCKDGYLKHDRNWKRYGVFGTYFLPCKQKMEALNG